LPRLKRSVAEAMRAAGGEVAPPPPQTMVRREVARDPASQAAQAAPSPRTSVANVHRTSAEQRATLFDAELEAAKTRFIPPPASEIPPAAPVEPTSPVLRGFPLGDYVPSIPQAQTAPEPPPPAPSAVELGPTAWAEPPPDLPPLLRPAFLPVRTVAPPPAEEPAAAPVAEEVPPAEPIPEIMVAPEPVAVATPDVAAVAAVEAAPEPEVESPLELNIRPPRLMPPPLRTPNRGAPSVQTRADDFLPSRGARL
jgi:hypothetical protein